ncbi:MAG: alpha/beta hydrolase [Tepidisphaera sp.]
MLGLAVLLLVGLLIACFIGVSETVRVLRSPPSRTYSWAVARGRPGDPGELAKPRVFREWSLEWSGLNLPAWDITGDVPEGPVVVVTHGWGDSRVTMLARADVLAKHASRVVVWDLPGHGDAPGRCGLGAVEAGALLSLLKTLPEGQRVVLYGFSLGAGVSIEAAASKPAGVVGVIAEAPYRLPATPAAAVLAASAMPYRWNLPVALWWVGLGVSGRLAPAAFDRASHAANLAVPLLVLHGELDEISPVADGRAIASSAACGRLVCIPGADHVGVWNPPGPAEIAERAVAEFLAGLGGSTGHESLQP